MQNNLQSTLYKSNKVLTVTFLQSERTCENWKKKNNTVFFPLTLNYNAHKGSVLRGHSKMTSPRKCRIFVKKKHLFDKLENKQKNYYLLSFEKKIYNKKSKHTFYENFFFVMNEKLM